MLDSSNKLLKKKNGEEAPRDFLPIFRAQELGKFDRRLVIRVRFGYEDRLKAPLLVLIVEHHDRHYAQRMLAAPASRSLSL